ncbi:MAG: hypothetical protein HY954_05215 [Deltaproteobacteria bacterium]|nr:hypothetical protein [Deltaproteobacteria bacterium]
MKDRLFDKWTLPVLLFFIIVTSLISFRLIQAAGTGLPASSEGLGPQDAVLNLWILFWDIHKFRTGLGGFFDANIFFPYENTLAYSEHLIGGAVLALPLSFFIKNPVLVYNVLLLSTFVLSGFGMYLLTLHLTGDRPSAVIAGIVFAYFPYHFTHLPRIQLEMMQWIPFTLLFLHRFAEKMDYRNIALSAVFYSLTFLSSVYYGVFLTFYVVFFFIWHILRKRFFTIPVFSRLCLFLLISAVIIIPVHIPYIKAERSGLARAVWENVVYSADILSYVSVPRSNWLWSRVLPIRPNSESAAAFFGLTAFALSLTGILLSLKRRSGDEKKHIRFYLALTAISIILSLGPLIHFNGREVAKGPYLLLYKYFPGFDGLRAPNRISVFAGLGMAVLAGFGVKFIKERIANIHLKKAVAALFAVLIILEFLPSGLKAMQVPGYDNMPPVYRWLSESAEDWPVFEYPMSEPHTDEAWYMYYSIFHRKRLANGYSGFTPPLYQQMTDEMKAFPSEDSISFLKALGVRYIIIHTEKLARPLKDISSIPGTVLLKKFDGDAVLEIKKDKDAE